ncbi:MAG: SLC13 family permease [Bacteroidia bacterium]|jgi:sodium-dependent dicarboxylate transporter 2/3/5|nr:SLC13 family permease [Bacteroidia bacterium]
MGITYLHGVRLSRRNFFKLLGPLLAALICFFTDLDAQNPKVTYMAAITVWMCTWWFSEAVSLAVTALVPVLMLPLFGISEVKGVAQQYTDSIIFLFIGGFMLAFAIEKWNLHKRIAFRILTVVGTKASTILFGVMLTSFLISNWISNTATTVMLFSAVYALIHETREHIEKYSGKFAAALLLGLAFSATIGGMATPVGTPPNMYFFKAFQEAFPEHNLNFVTWSAIGFPLSAVFLLCCYAVLNLYFIRGKVQLKMNADYFKTELNKLGPMSYEEKIVFGTSLIAIALWLTRADINFGTFQYKGWSHIFSYPSYFDDSLVALCAAMALFLIPSKNEKGKSLLEWEDAKKIRYDIILMFGSGFALAYGFEKSGLSHWLASSLQVFRSVSPVVLILCVCVVVTIISEFASNIASIQLVIPIMLALHKEMDVDPLLLMMPATFAASLGFMLPVATAANTIVFGTKEIQMRDMLRVGLVLDAIGILLITTFCYFYLA